MEKFITPAPKLKRKNEIPSTTASIDMNENVLEEESYLDKLRKIIKRDFFPCLKQMEDLETGKTNDEEIKNLTLNQFLNTFKSEDSETFKKLMKHNEELWRERCWWIIQQEKIERSKQQLALENSDKQQKKITYDNTKQRLAICAYEGQNSLFFTPSSHKNTSDEENIDKDQKKIFYENTRFNENDLPYLQKISLNQMKNSEILQNGSQSALNTPNLLGLNKKELKLHQKYNLDQLRNQQSIQSSVQDEGNTVNGYKLLDMPSIAPSQLQSPLITWGKVEGTPVLLNETIQYQIPKQSKKDELAIQLQQKFAKSKLNSKVTKNQQISKVMQSVTPSIHELSVRLQKNPLTRYYKKK